MAEQGLPVSDFSLHTPVLHFIEPSKYDLGAIDINLVRKVFQDNWIATVRDLKLLVEEKSIRELTIPQSLIEWIANECTSKRFVEKDVPRVKKFIFDNRSNQGICYWLGTKFGKSSWKNPCDLGLVRITFSSLMHDSAPQAKLLGPETLRIVTKPDPKSWFAFDFSPRKIKLSAYMIRHYLSWDTEALRNWNLEGSNDGHRWNLIMAHKDDAALKKKGQEYIWNVDCNQFYSHFRIFQTGTNSNRHHYLAMSGFEVWGDLKDETPGPSNPNRDMFVYQDDFDGNGIIHWLGCRKGTQPWRNPADLGLCRVIFSTLSADSEPATAAVGNRVVRCVSEPKQMQWMCIDLTSRRPMRLRTESHAMDVHRSFRR